MSGRSSVLARLRRARAGAGRYVAAVFAVAYLAAGIAPCAAAASATAAPGGAPEHARHAQHEQHAPHAHEHGAGSADSHHGHEPAAMPSHHEDGIESCPHCPLDGGAAPGQDDHSSCAALEDLTNAAPQAKSASAALAPLLGPAAFTLPPPLASPVAAPPWHRAQRSSVPLNVRHCVFLI
jgi:hypothetical protein